DVGMALELSDLPSEIDPPAGLEIRRVRSVGELADFAAVNAANWNPPDPAVSAFYRGAAQVLLKEDCSMRLFVAYRNDLAVAASELFVGGGVAGLYNIATRALVRRQGIGTALTWAAADEARRLGLSTATLQASEDGKGVYARLGFRACCHFAEYQ
ncbi:MAG: GNAT family N-acetyltransferase, partial [Terriglobales bacterium]